MSDYRDRDDDNDSNTTEEDIIEYNESYREFIAIGNNFNYMTDEEYEEIYYYDNHSDEDRLHGQIYIGSHVIASYTYVLNISISVKSFYHFPYEMIQQYLSTPSPNITSIEIMKLEIVDGNYYTVILKTHWIRLIQRVWKKVYAERLKIIQLRKSLFCQQYFEYNGKYPINACYLPSLYGMMKVR